MALGTEKDAPNKEAGSWNYQAPAERQAERQHASTNLPPSRREDGRRIRGAVSPRLGTMLALSLVSLPSAHYPQHRSSPPPSTKVSTRRRLASRSFDSSVVSKSFSAGHAPPLSGGSGAVDRHRRPPSGVHPFAFVVVPSSAPRRHYPSRVQPCPPPTLPPLKATPGLAPRPRAQKSPRHDGSIATDSDDARLLAGKEIALPSRCSCSNAIDCVARPPVASLGSSPHGARGHVVALDACFGRSPLSRLLGLGLGAYLAVSSAKCPRPHESSFFSPSLVSVLGLAASSSACLAAAASSSARFATAASSSASFALIACAPRWGPDPSPHSSVRFHFTPPARSKRDANRGGGHEKKEPQKANGTRLERGLLLLAPFALASPRDPAAA